MIVACSNVGGDCWGYAILRIHTIQTGMVSHAGSRLQWAQDTFVDSSKNMGYMNNE